MKPLRIISATVGLVFACQSTAFACENYVAHYDLRAETLPDCSFKNAGHERDYFGGAAKDVGNAKVAFRMTIESTCLTQEKLVVVDCASAEVLAVDGILDPEVAAQVKAGTLFLLGENRQIKYIQRPYGPIAVSEVSTIEALEQKARKAGFVNTRDLPATMSKFKRRERFDTYCGCKLFYPDSVGAGL